LVKVRLGTKIDGLQEGYHGGKGVTRARDLTLFLSLLQPSSDVSKSFPSSGKIAIRKRKKKKASTHELLYRGEVKLSAEHMEEESKKETEMELVQRKDQEKKKKKGRGKNVRGKGNIRRKKEKDRR